jgi:hypothetical protein
MLQITLLLQRYAASEVSFRLTRGGAVLERHARYNQDQKQTSKHREFLNSISPESLNYQEPGRIMGSNQFPTKRASKSNINDSSSTSCLLLRFRTGRGL